MSYPYREQALIAKQTLTGRAGLRRPSPNGRLLAGSPEWLATRPRTPIRQPTVKTTITRTRNRTNKRRRGAAAAKSPKTAQAAQLQQIVLVLFILWMFSRR